MLGDIIFVGKQWTFSLKLQRKISGQKSVLDRTWIKVVVFAVLAFFLSSLQILLVGFGLIRNAEMVGVVFVLFILVLQLDLTLRVYSQLKKFDQNIKVLVGQSLGFLFCFAGSVGMALSYQSDFYQILSRFGFLLSSVFLVAVIDSMLRTSDSLTVALDNQHSVSTSSQLYFSYNAVELSKPFKATGAQQFQVYATTGKVIKESAE